MSELTWGANGNSSEAALATAKRSVCSSVASRSREHSLSSSITAAMAVLKANRRRSEPTLSIAQWVLRASARSSPSGACGEAIGPWVPPGRSAISAASRHSRPRKRNTPSTPSSDQSASCSGGPTNRM